MSTANVRKRKSAGKRPRNPEELRARKMARLCGVSWSDVIALRNRFQAAENDQRATDDEARQAGWYSFVHYSGWSSSHLPYWRSGFQRYIAPKMARGADLTSIRYYDEIADSVRSQAPGVREWSTEDIWALLLSDYPPRRPVAEHYRNAVAALAHGEMSEDVPF